jgi:hypothetical protein
MKYLKILGLAAVAAMALMAFAGSASATKLYSGASPLGAGTEIKSSLASGTSATLTDTEGHTLDTCTGSTITGKTANAGSATETVKGTIAASALTWSGCTVATSTTEGGELEIHWRTEQEETEGIASKNGTLTGKGFKVSINTVLFGNCVYTAGAGTDLGTLTGSTTGSATMDINAVVSKSSGICNSTAKWVGTYTVTSPSPLHVTQS